MARVLENASALLGRQRAHRRLDVVRQVVFIDLPELRRRCALMTFMAYSMIPRTSELSGGLYVTPCPYARMHLLTSSVLCAARVVHDESAGRAFDARHKTTGQKRQEHLARSSFVTVCKTDFRDF